MLQYKYTQYKTHRKNIENSGSHYSNQEKSYTNKSGSWNKIYLEKDRPLHCLKLPQNSITKVYLGASVGKHFGSNIKGYQNMVLGFLEHGVNVSAIKVEKRSWMLGYGCKYGADGRRL